MNVSELASKIAKKEGNKSEARIGDIREILKIIATMEAAEISAGRDSMMPPFGPLGAIRFQAEKIARERR